MLKSIGHIAIDTYGREWFEHAGDVYVADAANPVLTHGYRGGRWECSRAHFDRHLGTLARRGLEHAVLVASCVHCGTSCTVLRERPRIEARPDLDVPRCTACDSHLDVTNTDGTLRPRGVP